jgi:low molecular weight protein-tyrosine phosphatase
VTIAGLAPDERESDRYDPPFRILYVCSGNLCRSVMAERLTRRALLDRSARLGQSVQVSSAGMQATPGQSAHPYTAAALARLGANVTGFAARPLTVALLRDSDLVLTATVRHRDRAVAMLPGASRRIFTIREFSRIAEHLPGEPAAVTPTPGPPRSVAARARWTVEAVAALRGRVGCAPPRNDDIADPPRRVLAFRACAREIARTVDGLVEALALAAAGRG